MERSSGFIVLLYGHGTDFPDVLGECIDFRSEFFRAVFAEPVLGCIVEIHGGIMLYSRKGLRCQMSNVPCQMSNLLDQMTKRPNWVSWSFGQVHMTLDMGLLTFDILEEDLCLTDDP